MSYRPLWLLLSKGMNYIHLVLPWKFWMYFVHLKKKRKRKEKKREKEEKLLSYALGSGETKDKVFFMVVILILCYSVFSEF